MRVLVTGHRGYLGGVLVPLLRQAGHLVVGLDSDLYRRCSFGRSEGPVWELEADLRDVRRCDLEGYQAVIHLGGVSDAGVAERHEEQATEINHRAAVRLAGVARAAGVERFVYASSALNYAGLPDPDQALSEDCLLDPLDPLARMQVLAERDLSWLASEGFSPVCLRLAPVFGYSPRHRLDLLVNELVAEAHATGKVSLAGEGDEWCPLVHVEDVARALACVLVAPRQEVHAQAFNLAASEPYRLRELVDLVRRTTRAQLRRVAGPSSLPPRTYPLDCEKIARRLGFQPIWSARLGILELQGAYRLHRLTRAELGADRYRRGAHLERLITSGALSPALRPDTCAPALARASA